jgi:hypothetical protein
MFAPVVRKKTKLKLAILGPTSGGKSYTALAVGCAMGKRVAVFDTEAGRSALYGEGDPFTFDMVEAKSVQPEDYIAAVKDAYESGYDVVILDSLTHAWFALLEGVDETVQRKAADGKRPDSWGAWKEHTPRQRAMIEAIVQTPIHVIVTVRTEMETVKDVDEKGKTIGIRRVGLQPKQRAGFEYEFDVIVDMDAATNAGTVTKSRCPALTNRHIRHPGKELAKELLAWLDKGVEPPKPPGYVPPTTTDKGWDVVLEASDAMHMAVTKEELEEAWRAWAAKVNNGVGAEVAKQERTALKQWCAFLGSRLGGRSWKPTDDEMALVEMLRSARARVVALPPVVNDDGEAAPAAE